MINLMRGLMIILVMEGLLPWWMLPRDEREHERAARRDLQRSGLSEAEWLDRRARARREIA